MPKKPVEKPAVKKPAAKKKSATVGSSAITLEELQALAADAPKRAGEGSKGGRPAASGKVDKPKGLNSPAKNAKLPASQRTGERTKRSRVADAVTKGTVEELPVEQLPQSMVHDGVALEIPYGREVFGSSAEHRTYLEKFNATKNGGYGGHIHPWSKFMSETGEPHYVDFNTDDMRDAHFKPIPVVHDANNNPSLKMRNAVAGVVTRMQAGYPNLNIKPNYLGNGVFHFDSQPKTCPECDPRNPSAVVGLS